MAWIVAAVLLACAAANGQSGKAELSGGVFDGDGLPVVIREYPSCGAILGRPG